MGEIKKIWNRIVSILSVVQMATISILFFVLFVFAILHLGMIIQSGTSTMQQEFMYSIAIFFCLAICFIFCINAFSKLDENEKKELLARIKEKLNESYKVVKYVPQDVTMSDIDKLQKQANVNLHLTLNARLDEENNICLVMKDADGNDVTDEVKHKKYKEFLKNFYVLS